MKKIVFGITSLDVGGAERVLVDLANRLKDIYDITIFTIYSNGDLESELDKKVKVVSLFSSKYSHLSWFNKKSISLLFSSRLLMKHIYKKYIKGKYNINIAFLEGPITSLFASESNNIAWVHTNLAKHINEKRKKQASKDYQKYKKIIFVSHDALDGFKSIFEVKTNEEVIHNYIDVKKITSKMSLCKPTEIIKSDAPSFLAVCRLVPVKGIDRLALVAKKLLEEGYKFKVYIIGDGPEHDNINNLIDKLELKDHFILLGKKDNPYPYMKKADYIVLPSFYEGYSMVLVEAMCLSKNIIITNTGTKEALEGYSNKLVVDNSFDGLYDGMRMLISNEIALGNKPTLKYNAEEIIKEIIDVLEE